MYYYSRSLSSSEPDSQQDSTPRTRDDHYCYKCKRQFVSKRALLQHYETSSRHNWCRKCSRDFVSPSGRSAHLKYSPRHAMCVHCDSTKDFGNEDGLRKHMSEEHSTNFCAWCNRVFKYPEGRNAHMENSHYACCSCGIYFLKDEGRVEHWKSSVKHKDTYCAICERDFENGNNLREVWLRLRLRYSILIGY